MRAYKTIFILIVPIVFCLCSCVNRTRRQLVRVDSLLNNEQQDSAQDLVRRIPPTSIHNDEVKAYYNLLLTRLLYRENQQIKNDSLIDFSINYYQKTGNSAKLAECYYYKGGIYEDRGETEAAISYLKEGEYQATGLKDLNIIHKLEESLAIVNGHHNEYAVSLNYAKKTLALSYLAHKANWIADALQTMAVGYNNLGKTDSARKYFNQAKDLIKYTSPSSQADYYSNLASVFSNDTTFSKECIRKAEKIGPNSTTYLDLAYLLEKRREYDSALVLLDKAYPIAPMDYQPWIVEKEAEISEKEGKHSEAEILYRKAYALQDSVNSIIREKDLSKLQVNYAYQLRALHAKQTRSYIMTFSVVAIIIGGLIVLLIIIYRKYNLGKERRKVMEKQALINLYQGQITHLNQNGESTKKKIKELRSKINQLAKDQAAVYHHGKQLYVVLKNGGTTVSWEKKDFVEFIEYYRLEHLELVNSLEARYVNLSPKNLFFLILQHYNTGNDQIMRIMDISSSAIRMINHRIKIKERVENKSDLPTKV
ncbi:MAG: hypothetical protein LKG14_07620 [Prevotella sp.]|nr:hypothetical protein [Prevotella sp.]